MKILITGGSGFVGRHLVVRLLGAGHQVVAVARRPARRPVPHPSLCYLVADTSRPGRWQDELQDIDVVVNLAGRPVFRYWTPSYKQSIYDSRVLTTRNLVAGLPEDRRVVLLSASAAGFYGDRGDDVLTEDEPVGNDFLATVCRDWEAEAIRAESKGARVVSARFGVILDRYGGALSQMRPFFRLGLGGPLGSGRQWFPWIALDDLLRGLFYLIDQEELSGPVNLCAPHPIRNREFAKLLARRLHRPAFMPAPAFIIRLLLGEFGRAILCSQRTVPQKLLAHGFTFNFPFLDEAFERILR